MFIANVSVQIKWSPAAAETLWQLIGWKHDRQVNSVWLHNIEPSIIKCHTKLSPYFTFLNSFIEWPKGKRSGLIAYNVFHYEEFQCNLTLIFTRADDRSVSHINPIKIVFTRSLVYKIYSTKESCFGRYYRFPLVYMLWLLCIVEYERITSKSWLKVDFYQDSRRFYVVVNN